LAGAAAGTLQLPNRDFDTGRPTRLGEYRLADETYAKLLDRFEGSPGKISDSLKMNVLSFYGSSGNPDSEKARAVLDTLRAAATATN
jgi:hypothetical protein